MGPNVKRPARGGPIGLNEKGQKRHYDKRGGVDCFLTHYVTPPCVLACAQPPGIAPGRQFQLGHGQR